MREPEHSLRDAFKDARDKIAFFETQLTKGELPQYEDFVEQQRKDREKQKDEATKAKAVLDDQLIKHPEAHRRFDPPIKIRDPRLRVLAFRARDEQTKLNDLPLAQRDKRLEFLEKLDEARSIETEKQRAQQEKPGQFREDAKSATRAPVSADFERAAKQQNRVDPTQEFGRAASQGRAKTAFTKSAAIEVAQQRAIEKAVEKQKEREQAQQAQEQDRQREDEDRKH